MKKVLSILSAIGLVASSSSLVQACSKTDDKNNVDSTHVIETKGEPEFVSADVNQAVSQVIIKTKGIVNNNNVTSEVTVSGFWVSTPVAPTMATIVDDVLTIQLNRSELRKEDPNGGNSQIVTVTLKINDNKTLTTTFTVLAHK